MSLKQVIDYLSQFEAERDEAFLATFAIDSDYKVIHIHIGAFYGHRFFNPTTHIDSKAKKTMKSTLPTRPRLKRKNRS